MCINVRREASCVCLAAIEGTRVGVCINVRREASCVCLAAIEGTREKLPDS